MKINEVEALVGITKKNIRFYESEGLLCPRRNSENDCREKLCCLDARTLLEQMERMEQEGATFMDKQKNDTNRRRYIAPVVVSCLTAVLMAGCIWLMLWAYAQDPADAPPLPLLALLVAIPGAVVLGVILALICRLREIQKGEEDDAKQY